MSAFQKGRCSLHVGMSILNRFWISAKVGEKLKKSKRRPFRPGEKYVAFVSPKQMVFEAHIYYRDEIWLKKERKRLGGGAARASDCSGASSAGPASAAVTSSDSRSHDYHVPQVRLFCRGA